MFVFRRETIGGNKLTRLAFVQGYMLMRHLSHWKTINTSSLPLTIYLEYPLMHRYDKGRTQDNLPDEVYQI